MRHVFHPAILGMMLLACGATTAWAQGGKAAAYLRQPFIPEETARGGAYSPFLPTPLTIFSNSAALPSLEHPAVSFAYTQLPLSQRYMMLAFGKSLGEFGGIGIGVIRHSIGGAISTRDVSGKQTGTTQDQDVALLVGGGIVIGPGSIGATIRYLHHDYAGLDGDQNGYAIDLAGTISFRHRLYIAASLNSIAGEMRASYNSGIRDEVPWQLRLGASYLHPLDESSDLVRLDPSGLPAERPRTPRSYLLFITEARTGQSDSMVVSLAAEAVPLSMTPLLGLRAGWNSKGDLSFGFFTNLSVESFSNLRLDCGMHRDFLVGDIAYHLSLTMGF